MPDLRNKTIQQFDATPAAELLAATANDRLLLSLDLIAANTDVFRYVHRGADAVLAFADSALTAPVDVDATIAFTLNGSPIGTIAIEAAGSAAGVLDSLTLASTVTLKNGDVVALTVGGGNTLTAFADVTITLTSADVAAAL